MRSYEIEAWSLAVIDRVVQGFPVEDSRVELKAEWIEPPKAARHIAAHANASRGAVLLWLLGVDEGHRRVPGVELEEMSRWLSLVRSQFDGLMPAVTHLNVPWGSAMVVALLFETDRAPFVVRNPHFESRADDPIAFEVPWREGTETRSADRSDCPAGRPPNRATSCQDSMGYRKRRSASPPSTGRRHRWPRTDIASPTPTPLFAASGDAGGQIRIRS